MSLRDAEAVVGRFWARSAAVRDGELESTGGIDVGELATWDGNVEREGVAGEVEGEDGVGGAVVVDGGNGWRVGCSVLVQPEGGAVGGDGCVLNVAAGADGNAGEGDGLVGDLALFMKSALWSP